MNNLVFKTYSVTNSLINKAKVNIKDFPVTKIDYSRNNQMAIACEKKLKDSPIPNNFEYEPIDTTPKSKRRRSKQRPDPPEKFLMLRNSDDSDEQLLSHLANKTCPEPKEISMLIKLIDAQLKRRFKNIKPLR